MVLDEWHVTVELPSNVASSDADVIREIVSTALDGFCERMQRTIRDATGVEGVSVVASQ